MYKSIIPSHRSSIQFPRPDPSSICLDARYPPFGRSNEHWGSNLDSGHKRDPDPEGRSGVGLQARGTQIPSGPGNLFAWSLTWCHMAHLYLCNLPVALWSSMDFGHYHGMKWNIPSLVWPQESELTGGETCERFICLYNLSTNEMLTTFKADTEWICRQSYCHIDNLK